MKQYKTYLLNKRLAESTAVQYVQMAQELVNYSQKPPELIDYQDLLIYVSYLQRQQRTKRFINHRLGSFRHYFAYLMRAGIRTDNPATHLKVKGQKRSDLLQYAWLEYAELETVFTRYETLYPEEVTNQVLLSLFVYQGLPVGELHLLKAEDIDLKTGKIVVTPTPRSNARTLSLDLRQMLLFMRFLSDKTGLLFPRSSSPSVHNRLTRLMKQLKMIHPGVLNSKQIRGSVIVHWLKTNDLRIAQYKAGHRYVSSTERYQVAHLEELQQEISKMHPLS